MSDMTLSALAERVGGKLTGDPDRVVTGAAPLDAAGPDDVSFLANTRYERHMAGTSAAAVIVAEDYAGPGESLIRCADPYYAFREAMVALYGFRRPEFEGVDERANVAPSAELGDGVRIAPFVTVSTGARIGPGTTLYPGVYVGPRCTIGRDCTLYPNVVLYDGCELGERVTIHAGSSIGHDGFGYATHAGDDGVVRHEKIPHAGRVVLEDDVEIGACCTIDRATMGPTIVGAGTKFSNLVAIGHGTRMGRHCLMVAQSGIAGSVIVGDYCVFAGQCGVVGHIRIGDGVKVGAQSGVVDDVPDGLEMLGAPARPIAEARKAVLAVQRLPELRNTVKRLSRQVRQLSQRLDELTGGRESDT